MAENVWAVLLWVLTARSVLGWQTFWESMSLLFGLKEMCVTGGDELIRVRMWFTAWPLYLPVANAIELLSQPIKFYVVSTVHFGMKLYNDQRNAQVFNFF
jgi:hypothetical protein